MISRRCPMTHGSFFKPVFFLLTAVFVLLLPLREAAAGGLLDRRAWVGLDLFPTFLAADDNIDEKKGADGKLHLLLVHRGRSDLAEEMADQLSRIGTIRGLPVRVSEVMIDELDTIPDDAPAGIFLVERMGDALGTVIRYGRDRHVIVFSPFPGDVENGVNSGMVISDRILPYINVETMRLSGVRMKPFFLRVAERYGE